MTPCEICQTPGVTKATVVGAFPIQLCAPCGREFVAWLLKQDEHTRLAEIELKISDSRCNAPHTGNADNLSYVNEIQTLRIELMDAASAYIGDRRDQAVPLRLEAALLKLWRSDGKGPAFVKGT